MRVLLLIARLHAGVFGLVFGIVFIASTPYVYRAWPDLLRDVGLWGLLAVPLCIAGPILLGAGFFRIRASDPDARTYGIVQGAVLLLFIVGTLALYFIIRLDGTRDAPLAMVAILPGFGPVFVPPGHLVILGWERALTYWRSR